MARVVSDAIATSTAPSANPLSGSDIELGDSFGGFGTLSVCHANALRGTSCKSGYRRAGSAANRVQ